MFALGLGIADQQSVVVEEANGAVFTFSSTCLPTT
jgi:hypothetical protein